jgi:hypothetical protein
MTDKEKDDRRTDGKKDRMARGQIKEKRLTGGQTERREG